MPAVLRPSFWVPRPYDEPDKLAWPIPYNLSLLGPAKFKPNIQTHFWTFYDDAYQFWQWEPPYNLALNGPGQFKNFANKRNTFFNDDAAFWQWEAPFNLSLIGKFYPAIRSQFPAFQDDPPTWQWKAAQRNPNLLAVTTSPFVPSFWRYNNDDASGWQWEPPYTLALSGKFQPLPLAAKFFTYFDDPSTWQWRAPRNTVLITTAIGTPFVPTFWQANADDASVWAWSFGSNQAIQLPPPVQAPSGNWDTSDPLFYDWWRRKHRKPIEEVTAAPELRAALAEVKPLPKRSLSQKTVDALAGVSSLAELRAFDAKAAERQVLRSLVAEFERLAEMAEMEDEDVILLALLH